MTQERLRNPQTNPSPEMAREYFLKRLGSIQEILREKGIPFRIIGSIANNSYTGVEINFAREGQRGFLQLPDIDLLVPRNLPQDQRDEVEKLRRTLLGETQPINLELFSGQMFIDWRPNEAQSYLTYRGLSVPVSSRLFDAVDRDFFGTKITTVAPRTLFHTFVVVGASLRPKDRKRIMPLGRYVRSHGARIPKEDFDHFTEDDFAPFHRYLEERQSRYAIDMWVIQQALELGPKLPADIYHALYKLVLNLLGSTTQLGKADEESSESQELIARFMKFWKQAEEMLEQALGIEDPSDDTGGDQEQDRDDNQDLAA